MRKFLFFTLIFVISINLSSCKKAEQSNVKENTVKEEITQEKNKKERTDTQNSKVIETETNSKDAGKASATPIYLYYPDIYEPPPIGIDAERQTVQPPAEGVKYDVWPNEGEENYRKIEGTIFKADIVLNDEVGNKVPVFFEMDEKEDIMTEAIVIGKVIYSSSEYTVAELKYTTSGNHKLTIRIFIPKAGDDYWVVVWNSREIIQTRYPKYLIQEDYLQHIFDN